MALYMIYNLMLTLAGLLLDLVHCSFPVGFIQLDSSQLVFSGSPNVEAVIIEIASPALSGDCSVSINSFELHLDVFHLSP